jgi:hypothetical protein
MKEVFAPRNRQLYDLVVSKADLLIEEEMPSCLLILCAHVASYEVVLHQWGKGNFSHDRPLVDFPGDIYDYASHSFTLLKSQQLRLLGLNPYERAVESA